MTSLEAKQESQKIREKVRSELFPGQGFFSYEEDFNLQIPINKDVSEIELAIEAPQNEILNIGKIDFVGADGKLLDKHKIISDAEMSSYYGTGTREIFNSKLRSGKLLHSCREERPSMRIKLNNTQYLKSIIISNRKDEYRMRSKFLTVKIFKDKKMIIEYQNCSNSETTSMLEEICKLSQVDLDNPTINHIPALKDGIKKAITNNLLSWNIKKLSLLLPLYSKNQNIDEFQIFITATIILKMLGNSDRIDTSRLSSFSNILNNHTTIQRVIDKVSSLNQSLSQAKTKIIISKHSVEYSQLRENREQYLVAINQAIDVFKSLGGELILCYGTLLGAIRENDFIAHDDDVDLLLINKATSREESLEIRNDIIASLKERKIGVWGIGSENFHININNCNLDIFICWREAEAIYLPMERFQIRQINSNILLPICSTHFQNAEYPAPAKPIDFLKERYGDDWNQPNPYHEFPWKVELR